MIVLALLGVTLLNLATGFGLLQLLRTGRFLAALDPLQRLVATFGAGMLLNSWIGMLLLDLRLFSAGALVLLAGLLGLMGTWRWWQDRSRGAPLPAVGETALKIPLVGRRLPAAAEYLLLALWTASAIALFFRPHAITWGGADAGVYVNLAAYIAEHGSVYVVEPVLADLDPSLYDAFLRTMPDGTPFWSSGLLVTDNSGRIWPPFYHLHALWQAVALEWAGVPGALQMSPYWALWGALAVYMVVRRLLSRRETWWVGLLALGGLSITALQVWFARYSTTEMLTQYLFWLGLWAFIVWGERDYRGRFWAALAGAAWGMTFMVRVDTFFVGVIPAGLVALLAVERRWHRSQIWFFLPLVLLPLHATVHALIYARPYFDNVYGYTLQVALNSLGWLIPLGVVGIGLLLLLLWRGELIWRVLERGWRTGRWVVVIAGAVLFLYAWFLRPRLGEPLYYVNPWDNIAVQQWNHMSLRHLGWYMFPTGVAISAAGILRLWWSLNRRTWALLFLGTLFSLLYLWSIRANGIHMYAMRRYVPVVLPFFVVAAALLGARLYEKRSLLLRAGGVLLLVLWLAGLVWSARGFVSQTDYAGLPAQIATLSERFPDGAILLFNQERPIDLGDHLGVPLTMIHGHHAFTLHHMDRLDLELFNGALRRWEKAGRDVFWIELGASNPLPFPAERLDYQFSFNLPVEALEGTYDRKPVQVIPAQWGGDVYRLRAP